MENCHPEIVIFVPRVSPRMAQSSDSFGEHDGKGTSIITKSAITEFIRPWGHGPDLTSRPKLVQSYCFSNVLHERWFRPQVTPNE